jgi:integrase/recombinase XerD
MRVQELVNELVRAIDPCERAVVDLWRKSRLRRGTIINYLYWVRRFRKYCEKRRLVETEQLTVSGMVSFLRAYIGPRLKKRTSAQNSRDLANNALHAWACALQTLGTPLPQWREKQIPSLPPLLDEYRQYRRVHNGASEGTLIRDLETAGSFLRHLQRRMKSIEQMTLVDVDAFVRALSTRLAKRTVADTCSSLRAFLRFLQITGKLSVDLASGVIAPRYRIDERPPRALPWKDVQKILRVISRSQPPGKRDFALLLLLATYGLGAAEVLALRLQDVDWRVGILKAWRPKTKVGIELPLLPAVAKALIAYIREERPLAPSLEHIFLRKNMPYERMTGSAIRHRIRHYARLAGIRAKLIGAHVFRHSHAGRQVDAGANIKVVSDILGHRSPSSTSIYVRVAFKRLRAVGLPVPR